MVVSIHVNSRVTRSGRTTCWTGECIVKVNASWERRDEQLALLSTLDIARSFSLHVLVVILARLANVLRILVFFSCFTRGLLSRYNVAPHFSCLVHKQHLRNNFLSFGMRFIASALCSHLLRSACSNEIFERYIPSILIWNSWVNNLKQLGRHTYYK